MLSSRVVCSFPQHEEEEEGRVSAGEASTVSTSRLGSRNGVGVGM